MHKTGIEDHYIIKNRKKLRCGYTTGTCAAAAAKAAAIMLFSGRAVHSVPLMTPGGILLDLEIVDPCFEKTGPVREALSSGSEKKDGERIIGIEHLREVSCAVRKDSGDDPDVTDGILVYAGVSRIPEAGIVIDGGTGVGRVTRKGMSRAVGEAAINPVPLQMIREAVTSVCEDFDYSGGLKVIISVPEGERLAARTFNPRLGIEGGISVLGTTGIVTPMSEAAMVESIRLEMNMLHSSGHEYLIVTPGNYGETFTKEEMSIDLSASMKCSNYIGETLDMAVNMGIKGILFVSHIGKFIKVAGGIMNTHSREADCRSELMAAFALRAGADRTAAMHILDTVTTEEALEIMEQAGVRKKAMELAAARIHFYLQQRVGGALRTEAILFSTSAGFLAETEGTQDLLAEAGLKRQ